MYLNSSIFPVDIKFQYNSSISTFSSIDGHPVRVTERVAGLNEEVSKEFLKSRRVIKQNPEKFDTKLLEKDVGVIFALKLINWGLILG